MHYTVGGCPESEAYSWNEKTYQELGRIVVLITSSKGEDRRRGYGKYFELRNHFLKDVFNDMVLKLDRFREGLDKKTISTIIEEISFELLVDGKVKEAEKIDSSIPKLENTKTGTTEEPEKVPEQMSLFSEEFLR